MPQPVFRCALSVLLFFFCSRGLRISKLATARIGDIGHGAGDFATGWGMAGSARDYTSGSGYQFMRRMAQVFGGSVIAACDEQYATSVRSQTLVRGVVYEGPVMRVDPFGGFTISEEARVLVDSRFDLY